MVSLRVRLILQAALVVTTASWSNAQTVDPTFPDDPLWKPEPSWLRRGEIHKRVSDFKSPFDSSSSIAGFDSKLSNDSRSLSLSNSAKIWCDEATGDCDTPASEDDGVDEEYAEVAPSAQQFQFTAFGPMAGFVDTMTAPAHTALLTNMLTSRLSTQLITYQLTEPGVGTGSHNAATHAQSWVVSRLLADEAMHRAAAANPEIGEIVLQQYNGCIAKYMNTTPQDNGGQPLEYGGWTAAVSRCLGGERMTPLPDNGFRDIDPTLHFGATDDPNHPSQNPDAAGANTIGVEQGETLENRLLLTDLLFNQAQQLSRGQINQIFGVPVDANTAFDSIRHDFRELLGDIRICISAGPNARNNPCGPLGSEPVIDQSDATAVSGRYAIQIRKLPPVIRPASSDIVGPPAPPEYSYDRAGIQWYYKNLVKQVWDRLFEILQRRCAFAQGNPMDDDSQTSNPVTDMNQIPTYRWVTGRNDAIDDGGSVLVQDSFWTQPNIKDRMVYTSTRGFHSSAALFDAFFELYKGMKGLRDPSSQNQNDSLDCTQLDPSSGADGQFYSIMRAFRDNDASINTRKNTFYRALFVYCHHIGSGHLYNTLITTRDLVTGLSGGPFASMTTRLALSLIHDAVGRSDLEVAYEENLEALREIQAEIFEGRTNQIGRGGAAVISQFAGKRK